jgi:hypothetical protein
MFNFRLFPVSGCLRTDSSHDELPEEITISSVFMAILDEVASPASSAAKLIAPAHPGIYTASRNPTFSRFATS